MVRMSGYRWLVRRENDCLLEMEGRPRRTTGYDIMRERRSIFFQRLAWRRCERKMAERKRQPLTSLLVQDNQPLIGIPFEEQGQDVVRYFTDEKAADAAVPHSTTKAALSVIGAWSDMDWEEMVEALDRIRHESKPTPPIEL
jgi:hypothetical protein